MRESTVSISELGALAGRRASRRWLSWFRDHSPMLAAIVFFLAMFWPFMRKGEEGEWRRCFLRAANRLQSRQIIHRPDEVNTYAYPPAMAMLAVPLAQLPFRWSLGAWYLTNVAAMVAAITCAWRLTGGPMLHQLSRPWSHIFWLGLLLASRFLVAPLENQQFDVLITAVLFAGCLALWRGHDTLAGIALGTAAAMKCTPLLFAPYLLWRGKARAAAVMLLMTVLLNRLPDVFWPREGGLYLADWVGTFLVKVARTAPGVWESDLILNQSLSGLINRLVQSGVPLTLSQVPSALTSLPSSTIAALRLLTYGLTGTLLLVTAWNFGRPGKSAPVVRKGGGSPVVWQELQTGIESSALVCLMLLLSPMSSKAHYVVLVLPCMLLARAVVEGRYDWRVWLPPLFILGPLTAKGITGKALGDLMLAWGFPTWFVIVLLVAMWRLRASQSVRAVEDGLPSPPRCEVA
jgi:hypothetical protein